ncbi:MAG: cell division protein ZapE [Hyphomicrobium sp.]
MSGVLLQRYDQRIALGELEPDAAQRAVAERLDALERQVEGRGGPARFINRWRQKPAPTIKGLYIHGGVGRGKTMLMDLFFEEARSSSKRRVHFHDFMADVHDRIAAARADTPGDPIPVVAAALARQAGLLCFDEVHVTDIADAMILGRLFQGLFESGVVVVATSNSHPADLYKNGLNRQLFLPFVDLIATHMDVVELAAQKDFRLDKLSGAQLYFTPADDAARRALDDHWNRLTGRHPGAPIAIDVKGRKLPVPLASMGVARFPFDDLCDRPLGANDYLHLAHAFHTVMIDGIPRLDRSRRDVARRFINLVDTLYDNRICLIASADAEPDALYPDGDGTDLFQRTASRLTEMRSEAYLAGHSGGRSRR